MKKEMTNYGIIQLYELLNKTFYGNPDAYIPVKVGFCIKRNSEKLRQLSEEIEEHRLEICDRYGTLSEDGSQYEFTDDKKEEAEAELLALYNLTQEIDLYQVSLEDIEDVKLTMEQIDFMSIMIKDLEQE